MRVRSSCIWGCRGACASFGRGPAAAARSLGPRARQRQDLAVSRSAPVRESALDQGDPLEHPLLARLAPEPLSAPFDADYLYRATRKRSVAIKQLLMNSHVVVGVGNIYANEALFRAGISPRRAARRLTRAEASALVAAIKRVLAEAIEIGGTTLRDYVNAEGTPGYFAQKLFVYERAKQACRVCKSPIKQRVQGQRSTYWCPSCQR